MTVGQSDYTPLKEDHYASILAWQVGIALHAIQNQWKPWRQTYLLIDATAGSGTLDDGSAGSPLRALQVLNAMRAKYRIILTEQDTDTCASLHSVMRETAEIRNTTYQQVIDELCRRPDDLQLGLLYVDPNGTPDFDALVRFAKSFPSMEVLVSVCANGVKRAGKTEVNLAEWIRRIPKRFWLVRKPYGKWQWTFLFGTNYERGFNKPYRKIDLYPTTSEIGRQYLEQASLTRNELQKKVQPPLTGLMPNTCGIPSSGPSGPMLSGERAVSASDASKGA